MTRPGVRPRSRARAGGDTLTRTYDRAGNVTAEGRTLAGIPGDAGSGTQAFTYDGLGRLVGSSGLAVAKSYGYDLDGNRVRKTEGAVTTTYAYDRTDALVSPDNGVTRSFKAPAYSCATQTRYALRAGYRAVGQTARFAAKKGH